MPVTSLIGKQDTSNINGQILRGVLVGLVSTMLVWVAGNSSLLSYRVESSRGNSTELVFPSDALCVKMLDVVAVNVCGG